MAHLTGNEAWLLAIAVALALLAAPPVIAAVRGAEPIGLVIVLTVLGATWFLALIAAFALPRASRPARPPAPRAGYPPAPPPRR